MARGAQIERELVFPDELVESLARDLGAAWPVNQLGATFEEAKQQFADTPIGDLLKQVARVLLSHQVNLRNRKITAEGDSIN